MSTVAILGAGIMASALTFPVTDNRHQVNLVGTHLDRDIIDSIQRTGIHPELGLKMPENVTAFQLEEAEAAFANADVAMSGVNSFGVDWAGAHLATLLKPGMKVLVHHQGYAGH